MQATFNSANPLIRKLSRLIDLSDDDLAVLHKLCRDVRRVEPRVDLIKDGERPDGLHLVLDGWSCRYKIVKNGKKQITALLLPGDFCDLDVDRMDHAIGTITASTIAYIDRAAFEGLAQSNPAIVRGLWKSSLIDQSVSRSWIVSLGVRDARSRLAHLICELRERLGAIDLEIDGRFSFPLRQIDLGDALGLTPVHVNRVVRQLATDGILEISQKTVSILDAAALATIADFDPIYLRTQSSD